MPKPYDATTKFLLEFNPSGWKPFLGIQSSARVETIDADVSTVSGQADKVLRVLDRIPWLIHLELQASRDPLLALRMQRYNVLLVYKFGCVVYSVVLLLRLSADGPELTGRRQSRRPDGPLISDFRYDVIRLWQLTPEQILSGDFGDIATGSADNGVAAANATARSTSPSTPVRRNSGSAAWRSDG